MKKKMKYPVQQSKKSFKKAVIEHLLEQRKSVRSIKRDMPKMIEDEVMKNFEAKELFIKSLHDEVVIHKELLIKKGIIKREEVNAEYEKLRKKRNG